MSLLMFWRSATLLSESFSTIWGTICYKFRLGILNIYSIIFKETKATLKLPSPSNFINKGTRFFIKKSSSNSCLLTWNLVCSYSMASNLTFQSFSFLKSSTSFFPTICSIFYNLLVGMGLGFEIGGSKRLDYLFS